MGINSIDGYDNADEADGTVAWSDRSLRIFDAAVRHGSLSAAARALRIGQPAVSHAIARLEAVIGGPILVRSSSGVTPTPLGIRLHETVGPAYASIDAAMTDAIDVYNEAAVTVSVSTSLASYWLMPRLPGFKNAHPEIELRVITSDSDSAVGIDDADLWIPLGRVAQPGLEAVTFCPERVVPVAAPALAASLGRAGTGSLRDAPLLHLEERYAPRFSWDRWFEHQGVAPPSFREGHRDAYRSNDYSLVLQAAIAGQGAALGWVHIVSDLIEAGSLVALAEPVESDQPFEILYRSRHPMRSSVAALRDWLQEEMRVQLANDR